MEEIRKTDAEELKRNKCDNERLIESSINNENITVGFFIDNLLMFAISVNRNSVVGTPPIYSRPNLSERERQKMLGQIMQFLRDNYPSIKGL